MGSLGLRLGAGFLLGPVGAALMGRYLQNHYAVPAGPVGDVERVPTPYDTSIQLGHSGPTAFIPPSLQMGAPGTDATNLPPVNVNAPYQAMNPFQPGSGLAYVANAQTARQIGGNLGFGGGHYNNGVGAGTGYGAANYANDAWGNVASSFGVGGMAGGARDQAMSSYGPTGRPYMN